MAQYVLRFTDDAGQPLTDTGIASVYQLFTGEPVHTTAVDANGFSVPYTFSEGILYRVVTSSALVPSAVFQPSNSEIISINPASAARAAFIVGSGVPSPPLPPTSSVGELTFAQPTPAFTWTIAHNLGRYPSVTTQDQSGGEIYGDIAYPSLNSTIITFSAPLAGIAYLV